MKSENPGSKARTAGYPILRLLISFPIACFFGALATDIVYARTADMMWADFSAWLLAAGIIIGVVAAVPGCANVIAYRHVRAGRETFALVTGSLLTLILAFFDNLVHSRDAWTSVVPYGLVLSAVTVFVILLTAWFGSPKVYSKVPGFQYSGVRQ